MLFVIAYVHVGGTRDGRRAWNRNEVFLKAMAPPAIGFFVAWIGGGGEASELELTLTGRKRRPKDVTSVSKHSRTIPCRCHCW